MDNKIILASREKKKKQQKTGFHFLKPECILEEKIKDVRKLISGSGYTNSAQFSHNFGHVVMTNEFPASGPNMTVSIMRSGFVV